MRLSSLMRAGKWLLFVPALPVQRAASPPPECILQIGPVPIDLCNRFSVILGTTLFGPIVDAAIGIYQGGVSLVTTDAAATYQNSDILALHQNMLLATDLFLLLTVLITAIRMMWEQSIMSWADFRETLPQVLFAFVLAQFSLSLTEATINLNNAFCALLTPIAALGTINALLSHPIVDNLFATFLVAILAIMFLVLVVESSVRIAVLNLCIVLASAGCFALAWKPTQRFGIVWLNTFLAAAFTQFLQLLCLVIGAVLVQSLRGQENTFVTLLAGIAVTFTATAIPFYTYRWAIQPVFTAARTAGNAVVNTVAALG